MPGDVTQLLNAIDSGEPNASEELLPLVYEELRRLAAHRMAQERPGHTLQATALVHEAWIRLSGSTEQEWRGRTHFFSAAAESMRRILVDQARRRQRIRHGGHLERVPIENVDLAVARDAGKCLAVSEQLDLLMEEDPEKAEVVRLKVFGGFSIREIANIRDCSDKTVQRHWLFAKAWLSRELKKEP